MLITKRQIGDEDSYETGFIVQFKIYNASSTKFNDIASSLWDTTSHYKYFVIFSTATIDNFTSLWPKHI